MFIFEKRTQIPVNIRNRNPKLAGIILSQYGGLYSKRLYNINTNIRRKPYVPPY